MSRNERYEGHSDVVESAGADREGFRWRAWPCAPCSGEIAASDYLRGSEETGFTIREQFYAPEKIAEREILRLREWVSACPHTEWKDLFLDRLAEGSEHVVYLDSSSGLVWKLTRPGVFGDSYYLIDNVVNQRNCSPAEYLVRLELWRAIFGVAPLAIGISSLGQIVSTDSFVPGVEPTQSAVDDFLISAGLSPVKKSCWLWKKEYPDLEVWVGDARKDNFVETSDGIVPIDLRLWSLSVRGV